MPIFASVSFFYWPKAKFYLNLDSVDLQKSQHFHQSYIRHIYSIKTFSGIKYQADSHLFAHVKFYDVNLAIGNI